MSYELFFEEDDFNRLCGHVEEKFNQGLESFIVIGGRLRGNKFYETRFKYLDEEAEHDKIRIDRGMRRKINKFSKEMGEGERLIGFAHSHVGPLKENQLIEKFEDQYHSWRGRIKEEYEATGKTDFNYNDFNRIIRGWVKENQPDLKVMKHLGRDVMAARKELLLMPSKHDIDFLKTVNDFIRKEVFFMMMDQYGNKQALSSELEIIKVRT